MTPHLSDSDLAQSIIVSDVDICSNTTPPTLFDCMKIMDEFDEMIMNRKQWFV